MKFQEGDKVVVKDIPVGTSVDGCNFVGGMRACVGKIYTVRRREKFRNRIKLEEDDRFWSFVDEWLRPVEMENE